MCQLSAQKATQSVRPGAVRAAGWSSQSPADRTWVRRPVLQSGEPLSMTSLPGLRPHPDQHAQTAAVEELQPGQIGDDPRVSGRNPGQRSLGVRGNDGVQFPRSLTTR
jgi:hypothetical protein